MQSMHPAGRTGRARLWAVLAAGAAIMVLCAGAWVWQSGAVAQTEGQPAASMPEHTLIVEPRSITQTLDIPGRIGAGKSFAIVAPFDSVIREKHADIGDPVEVGDVLLVLDTNDIASRRRDAKSAYLKAAMAKDVLDKWESGPDMLRARRALESAQSSLATLERQAGELKALLERGIVSRNEYDGVASNAMPRRIRLRVQRRS